jgi:hypothetical protein
MFLRCPRLAQSRFQSSSVVLGEPVDGRREAVATNALQKAVGVGQTRPVLVLRPSLNVSGVLGLGNRLTWAARRARIRESRNVTPVYARMANRQFCPDERNLAEEDCLNTAG